MNDWDNFDNFPEDEDNDFDWMNDNDQSDDTEGDGLDTPDWLSDMGLPSGNDNTDEPDDPWGDLDDPWGTSDESSSPSASDDSSGSDDPWGMSFDDDNDDDDGIDNVDDFLFGTSSDDSDDEVDDFLLGTSSDDSDDEVDDFLFGTSSDESDDEVDDFLLGTSSDDSGDEVDDFLFGTSSDDSDDEVDDLDYGDWGDLSTDDNDDDWGLGEIDDSSVFASDDPAPSSSSLDDLGVPDWLSDMPDPGEDNQVDDIFDDFPEPLSEDAPQLETEDSPDWLSDMPVPGENAPAFDLDALGDDWLESVDDIEAEIDDDLGMPEWLVEQDPADLDEMVSDDEDMLDLFDDLDENEPIVESIGDDDFMDLFDDLDEDNDDLIAEAESDDLLDLLGDFDSGDSEELGDLLASLDTGNEDGDLDDLLASLDTGDEDNNLDDLFASSVEDDNLEMDDALSIFDDLDDADSDSFDFLDADDKEPDTNYMADLFGEDQETFALFEDEDAPKLDTELDDLDFLEGVAESDEDSLDFLDTVDAEAENELDFFSDLEVEEAGNDLDFFDELDEADPSEDFFVEDTSDLDIADSSQEILLPNRNSAPITDENDDPSWLDNISELDADELAQASVPQQDGGVDLDTLIGSFDFEDNTIDDDDDDFLESSASLDNFFDQLDEEQTLESESEDAIPAWLESLQKGGDSGESAANLLRDRENRSLDELDDRLIELRDRGIEVSSSSMTTDDNTPANTETLAQIIPNVDEALVPARLQTGEFALSVETNITPEQAQRAELLQGLVGSALGSQADDDTTNAATSIMQAIMQRADRFVIAIILIAAVLVPFAYPDFNAISVLPDNEFATESPQFAAFDLIENLRSNDYVLIGAEYGAAGARELDTATQSLMEHIIINGGIPVVVSSDAIGLLRTENIAVELMGEDVRNAGYYIVGLLPGGNVGLRDFSQNFDTIVDTDITGRAINLQAESLNDFAAIILISESGERVRNWMEQIAPITNTDIVVITSQSARPIALPYVDSIDNVVAMLTSYNDAYTYQQMSLALYNPSETPLSSPTSVATATIEPTDAPTAEPTDAPTAEPTDVPTETDVPPTDDAEEATDEAENADAQAVDATDEPADTPTTEPSETPEPTETPTPDSLDGDVVEVAVVIAESAVDIHAGPNETFPVVATAEPEEELAILRLTLDNRWLEVVQSDGTAGWINAEFVEETEVLASEFDGETEGLTFGTIEVATVVGNGRVNIRTGAGGDFATVAGLDPNTQVRVIGYNAEADWVNIVLPNGGEGWVARFLVRIEDVPAEEWEGASKDGFFPVYYDGPIQIAQADDEDNPDTVLVGRNAAGFAVTVYTDADLTQDLAEIANGAEFLVLEEGVTATQILLADGQVAYVETRLIVIDERQRNEVDFAPTLTPSPTPTATLTPSPTPTATPILPEITPAPFVNPETRSSSQSLGLLTAIVVIALGNIYWILRWLGRREQ